MTHGWNTTKTETGFRANVTRYVEGEGTTVLQSHMFPTRARAEGFAKRWVLYYRRGGQ